MNKLDFLGLVNSSLQSKKLLTFFKVLNSLKNMNLDKQFSSAILESMPDIFLHEFTLEQVQDIYIHRFLTTAELNDPIRGEAKSKRIKQEVENLYRTYSAQAQVGRVNIMIVFLIGSKLRSIIDMTTSMLMLNGTNTLVSDKLDSPYSESGDNLLELTQSLPPYLTKRSAGYFSQAALIAKSTEKGISTRAMRMLMLLATKIMDVITNIMINGAGLTSGELEIGGLKRRSAGNNVARKASRAQRREVRAEKKIQKAVKRNATRPTVATKAKLRKLTLRKRITPPVITPDPNAYYDEAEIIPEVIDQVDEEDNAIENDIRDVTVEFANTDSESIDQDIDDMGDILNIYDKLKANGIDPSIFSNTITNGTFSDNKDGDTYVGEMYNINATSLARLTANNTLAVDDILTIYQLSNLIIAIYARVVRAYNALFINENGDLMNVNDALVDAENMGRLEDTDVSNEIGDINETGKLFKKMIDGGRKIVKVAKKAVNNPFLQTAFPALKGISKVLNIVDGNEKDRTNRNIPGNRVDVPITEATIDDSLNYANNIISPDPNSLSNINGNETNIVNWDFKGSLNDIDELTTVGSLATTAIDTYGYPII